MKFAIATIFAACVAAKQAAHKEEKHEAAPMEGFSGMSFLDGPGDMKKAEEMRAKYIHEQEILSRDRKLKVGKYFGARDAEATAKKARAAFHAAMVKAKGLAAAAKAMHIAAIAHEEAMRLKREDAFTKWEAARNHAEFCLKRGNASTAAYKAAVDARARAFAEASRRLSAMKAAWAAHKKAETAKVAARENYVKWAKAHRSAVKGTKAAALKRAEAEAAHAKATKHHAASVASHIAAIRRRAAARAAAIAAHIKAQKHAANSWKFLAQAN